MADALSKAAEALYEVYRRRTAGPNPPWSDLGGAGQALAKSMAQVAIDAWLDEDLGPDTEEDAALRAVALLGGIAR
jgi:hypothetical protein